MSVDLSIKRVPDQLVERLRRRAAAHHRSVQGELMVILEDQLGGEDGPLTLAEILAKVRSSGLATPSESLEMIRADRKAEP